MTSDASSSVGGIYEMKRKGGRSALEAPVLQQLSSLDSCELNALVQASHSPL
jgi:hypothetical protein